MATKKHANRTTVQEFRIVVDHLDTSDEVHYSDILGPFDSLEKAQAAQKSRAEIAAVFGHSLTTRIEAALVSWEVVE